ncbi:Sulfotransferase domain protein [Botrimarina colliarenosi]|uniref:Sulfotransferase domain protein n=2 Tax=Botrimarina colliarenosi TaxID=2528001 RepID=A0A5C6AK01_9BACT|nr:Sulfotransferase domain protein [Botrimarina colliarenosi]
MNGMGPIRRYTPVVILGAGRSGTNLLRDGLTRLNGVATWPCDEVNYLWRSGAKRFPTDEFTPSMATPAVQRRIVAGFDWVARRYGAKWVVEKTCANTLRPGFVNAVLPNARFIHLTRDGFDVTASAMKRWTAPIELRYLAKKARFVPLSDLPYYASRYLLGHARRRFSEDRALRSWGPRFEGIEELRASNSLAVVCATQWRRCVDVATTQLAELPSHRVYSLTYESLVNDPARSLKRVADFLEIPTTDQLTGEFAKSIRPGSVGAGKRSLSESDIATIQPIVHAASHRFHAA